MDAQSQGMVAVVRGLGDSQLAVTVLDSGKQYTLLPTSVLNRTNQQTERSSSTNTPYQHHQHQHQSQCHAAAQATDGQYATVYKTTHCRVRPTSPPIQLTEFPPQRAAVAQGHGNFEVGGTGSGDTSFNLLRTNGSYRGGGMVWPDRGCVCSPRPSREPDPFAESLRKYPAISPERSAEIVERLINYTQGKNFAKVMRQSSLSPTRLSAEIKDKSLSRGSSRCRACDLEKNRYRIQGESPTKDRPSKTERLDNDGESRKTFTKSYDVRYVKDMSRKIKDGIRNNAYTSHCPSIKEAFEVMNNYAAAGQKPVSLGGHSETGSGNHVASMLPLMVNSQTQAVASMACKEVSTESRHKMFSRNVAVPLSPQTSDISRTEGAVFDPHSLLLQASVQTLVIPIPVTVRKSVQTTQSSIDISSVKTTHNTKKCRSEIELSNKDVREEILGWLVDVLHSTYSKNLRADVIEKLKEKLKNICKDFGGEEAKVKLKVESIDDDCPKHNLGDISDELVKGVRFKNRYYTQIYRAEVVPYKAPEDLKKAIKDWLLELPVKTRDHCGKYLDEEQILTNFVKRLKKALFSPDYDTKKLRNEIVTILQDIPIDTGSTNRIIYLNMLANNLIKKLLNANCYGNQNQSFESETEKKTAIKKFRPNENEIRDLVRDEIIDFLDKFNIKLSLERLQNIETNVLEIIMDFLNNMHSNNNEGFIKDVVHALQSIGAFEHQALYFANLILDHIKELMTKVKRSEQDHARRLHIMTVLNSTVNETTENTKELIDGDIQNTLDTYIQQLTHQIDEWLAGLELEIPWSQDESFRQVVVNDLAEDIVDRHKYVELNHNTTSTDKDELEYLKYLIFKWINKLVGEEHQETIEHAPKLLERIRRVPVPFLTKPNNNRNSKQISPESNQRTSFRPPEELGKSMTPQASAFSHSVSKNVQAFPVPIAGPSRIENPTATTVTGVAAPNMGMYLEGIRNPTSGIKNPHTLKRLNEIYDSFVRTWVQNVPIPAYTPEELSLADTMRVGLYNGIFQIVTKLKFQPQLLFNPFYYQDALDEELEELLSLLPQTTEFLKRKNIMKAIMIEKTTELNELMKTISSPYYQERAANEYRNYIPKFSTDLSKENPVRIYEDLQTLNIAEDFLLFTKYKEEDPLKAYMYRQKLTERIREFVNEIKRIHGKELKDISPDLYMNQVLHNLQQVPIPSEQAVREEAHEILLGHAIEEWYKALPVARNNNFFEQLKRRHLRDALTKKIQNMEKSLIASENTPEYELRHEISRFLEKIPLGKDENLNINYMVDALVDKVKDIVTPKLEAAALHNTTVNYSDFGDNAALHSTNLQVPEGYRLVGPLPPCCAAGLDKILAQPGPSSLQVQTPADQNLTQSELTKLERQASMIGGGPPLITTPSFGQQISDEPRSPSPADQENTRDEVATVRGSFSEGKQQSRVEPVLDAQNSQGTSHRRPSMGESGNIQKVSGSAGGQRRPSMGESEYNVRSQSIGESANINVLHVSGYANGQRRPNMGGLETNTQSTSMGKSDAVSGQRKPSMGLLGNNTQNAHIQISTTDTKHKDGPRRRQCSRQTVEYSHKSCKVNCSGTSRSLSQSKLCFCEKSNAEKVTSGEGKLCFCTKSNKNSRFCSNTATMTETKPCLCNGSKYCFCPAIDRRTTLVSKSIEGQTSSQAISNTNRQSTTDRLKIGEKNSTEYSVTDKPVQKRYFEKHKPGTDFDYDMQMTEGSNTLTSEHLFSDTQGFIREQINVQDDEIQVDKNQRSRNVRGHVPGPTSSARAAESPASMGAQGHAESEPITTTDERARTLRPTLAQSSQPRNSNRVSIISPPSLERMKQLSAASMAATNQQEDPRVHSGSPENQTLTGDDVGTYQGFIGGRPLSSSLQEQTIGDPEMIEPELRNMQPQVDTSMPSRRISAVPIQSSPNEVLDPILFTPLLDGVNDSLSNTITPQWVSFPHNGMQQPSHQMPERPCVCPPHMSMLSQRTMLSPEYTGLDPNQIFAPAFPPGQMFTQMNQPVQTGLPGMFFGPNATLPGQRQFPQAPQSQFQQTPQSQFQQAPQRRISQPQSSLSQPLQESIQSRQASISQPRQASISQPRQASISQPRQASISHPRQASISHPRQASISQPGQSVISQPRQGSISQPRQGRMSQSQQSRMTPLSFQDSRYLTSRSFGAIGHDFPQDGRHTMDRSMLMQTIPPESQTVQTNMERQISMPNRTQNLQGVLLEDRLSGAVQVIQEEQRSLNLEGDIQSVREQNEPGRSSRASVKATFSQNEQSMQGSIQSTPLEQVEEIRQQLGPQDLQRGVSQRRESALQSPRQEVSPQSYQQEVFSQNIPQDSNFQQVGLGEINIRQADRRVNQPDTRFGQNAAEQSAGWHSFREESPQTFGPQNIQQVQDVVSQGLGQSERRISQNQSAVNFPITSADQLSFQQQAGLSPAIQDLVDQGPVDAPHSSYVYHPGGQGLQNGMMMSGFIPGQPVQIGQDPRAYIQPAAFSTPQRPIPPVVPQRPVRRGKRRSPRRQDEMASSGLDQRGVNFHEGRVIDLSDSESDRGPRIRCRCYERLKRLRRRHEMYEDECNIPCPYGHYYYSCF